MARRIPGNDNGNASARARELCDEALQLLVVGDPETVLGPCEDIGFGPATLYDTEGTIIPKE